MIRKEQYLVILSDVVILTPDKRLDEQVSGVVNSLSALVET